jgi:fused signal recognition particle receptor
MFGFLKNKLKEWVSSAKDKLKTKEKVEETKVEEAQKKQKKGKKPKKEKIIKKAEEGKETPDEAVQELEKEHEETEKGFFKKVGKFFGKKAKPEADIESSSEDEIITPKPTILSKLKSSFIYKITEDDFNELFNDLEMLLLENNVALEVVEDIKSSLSKKLTGKEIKKNELESEIKKELKSALNEILIDPDNPIEAIKFKKDKPFVILFFGINGTGKTTSIAKFAHLLKSKYYSVVLAAADTFRAASIEQISEHAKKLNLPLIRQDYGADPSAVGFDAIKYAKAHNIDVVLIDTAGRMHTKSNLLDEMEKICRVTNPDLKIFVAESIAGNDATEQAKTFHEMIDIDGSILTKADVDEKGGTILSISHATHKPIFYLGTGQSYDDLKLFNKQEFIESLGL